MEGIFEYLLKVNNSEDVFHLETAVSVSPLRGSIVEKDGKKKERKVADQGETSQHWPCERNLQRMMKCSMVYCTALQKLAYYPSESRPLPRVLEEPQPPHNLHAIGAAWKRMVRRVCEGPPARSYITDEGTSQITMSCVNPPLILLVLDDSWVNCFICLFFQSEKTNCNCVTCSMDFSMKPSLAWSRGEI